MSPLLERMEAPAAARDIRGGRGDAAPRPQAEGSPASGGGHTGAAGGAPRLGREPLCPAGVAASRFLLAGRAARGAGGERPYRRHGGPRPRRLTARKSAV